MLKQPFSATVNEKPAVICYNRQPEGIQLACERQKHMVINETLTIPKLFHQPNAKFVVRRKKKLLYKTE